MWAAIPIKPVGQAKSRLSHLLPGADLSRLFIAMLKDVLGALRQSPEVERLLLVSSAARVGSLATEYGAELLEDDGSGGLNGACELAARHTKAGGGERLLILHGDLPLITPADIQALTNNHPTGDKALSLIPDGNETGTNGILATPPNLISYQFGAGSLQKHIDAAHSTGAKLEFARAAHLALDVDAPEDLKILKQLNTRSARRDDDCHTIKLLNELGWPTI